MVRRELELEVRARARGACEYCHFPQAHHPFPFQLEHVIALQHGGETISDNLALACGPCNLHKGDPDTGALTPLFHPRKDVWTQHFRWDGAVLVGLTSVGRTTVRVLDMNAPSRVPIRAALIAAGLLRTETGGG